MATLSYRSAAKIAAREMHSSRGKFFFVILSVAIGVAALTGVRGFSSSFRSTLLDRARSIMAADLSARMFQHPTAEEQKGLDEIEAAEFALQSSLYRALGERPVGAIHEKSQRAAKTHGGCHDIKIPVTIKIFGNAATCQVVSVQPQGSRDVREWLNIVT